MTLRKDFRKQFQPETFSFREYRDMERVYMFYLKKLMRRSVKVSLSPRKILTPHEFSLILSLEVTEEKEPGDFYAGGMYLNLYDFLLFTSNPKEKLVCERLAPKDQEIYQKIFQDNPFVGKLRTEDLLHENISFQSDIREIQARRWEKIIDSMLDKIQKRIKEAGFPCKSYISDQVLYILPIETNPFTVSDLRKAELENIDLQGRHHVVIGDITVNPNASEDINYIRMLSNLYGEDIKKNIRYIDSFDNEYSSFNL